MKVYLSHKIQGSSGAGATNVEMERNCKAAVTIGDLIEYKLSMVDVYVPGGPTEQFVRLAYAGKYLSIAEILEIDCKIIDICDAVVVYVPEGDKLQGGRLVEYEHAVKTNKPVFVFSDYNAAVSWLSDLVLRS